MTYGRNNLLMALLVYQMVFNYPRRGIFRNNHYIKSMLVPKKF